MKNTILTHISKTLDDYQLELRDKDMMIISLKAENRELKKKLLEKKK